MCASSTSDARRGHFYSHRTWSRLQQFFHIHRPSSVTNTEHVIMSSFSPFFAAARQALICLVLLLFVILGSAHRTSAEVRTGLDTVAITGIPAPAPATSGDQFTTLDWATISPTGTVAFHADLKSNNSGLFLGSSPQNLQTIATLQTTAPGTNAKFYASSQGVPISPGGVVARATDRRQRQRYEQPRRVVRQPRLRISARTARYAASRVARRPIHWPFLHQRISELHAGHG